MTVKGAIIGVVLGTSVAADPLDFCAQLADISRADWVVFGIAAPGDCASVVVLGSGAALSCKWKYAYRAPATRDDFDRIKGLVAGCFEAGEGGRAGRKGQPPRQL